MELLDKGVIQNTNIGLADLVRCSGAAKTEEEFNNMAKACGYSKKGGSNDTKRNRLRTEENSKSEKPKGYGNSYNR